MIEQAKRLVVTSFCTYNEVRQRTRMAQWSHSGCPGTVYDYGSNKLGGNKYVLRYCGCNCHE